METLNLPNPISRAFPGEFFLRLRVSYRGLEHSKNHIELAIAKMPKKKISLSVSLVSLFLEQVDDYEFLKIWQIWPPPESFLRRCSTLKRVESQNDSSSIRVC